MHRFEGRRAIVTGAGAGIGKAVAARLGEEGARVVGLDLQTDGIEAETALVCDVADASSVDAAVAQAIEALGGVDIVCNIAGIGHFCTSHEETAEAFAKIVGVNLNGTFHVCRATLPHLLANGDDGGVIVNTASTAGLMGQPWSAAYCASKGGVVLLTKALAVEYADRNIRVNAVAPGGTNTAIQHAFSATFPADASGRKMAKMMSAMGMAEPAEMASTFAFVASAEARYMTGAIVTVDGGITA
jgi:meso-butanediol dehydrogenase / (S,S)-butanediol dehydrogenase / diacetyl reductase